MIIHVPSRKKKIQVEQVRCCNCLLEKFFSELHKMSFISISQNMRCNCHITHNFLVNFLKNAKNLLEEANVIERSTCFCQQKKNF